MKVSNLFFIVFIFILFFISSCTKNQQIQQSSSEDLEFKKLCIDSSNEWMYMKPTQDGKFIKYAESCWGCMVEGIEHVCDMKKFEGLMKNGMENNMRSMQHMAMTAHAGARNSVDVHMYNVGFIRPDVQPEKEALLKFTINDIQSKKPIQDLEIVHDKIMHVVLVRDDLRHFDHVHPEMTEQGVFAVPYKFSSSGTYRIWIDFTVGRMQHIVDFDINVPGDVESEEKNLLDGIKVNFLAPNEIFAGKEIELKFEIFDKNNKQVPITEKFLAADAHLISIDESLEEFEHNHDEKFDKDNKISFIYAFEKAGKHKILVQFSVEGKAKTASFDVAVK